MSPRNTQNLIVFLLAATVFLMVFRMATEDERPQLHDLQDRTLAEARR